MNRTVRVTGKGILKVRPDLIRLIITLTGTEKEYSDALRRSTEDTDALKNTMEKLGFQKSALKTLAFNVDTKIVDRDIERTKMGRVKEAYYCVRATLPNGRSVESDALCSRSEKGKDKVSDHTIMSTAKTRATNRAIAELIGAGEVSAEEMTAEKMIASSQSKFLKEDKS